MLEVIAVKALDRYWLRITLSNGDVIERDVSKLLHGPVFEPVREHPDVFAAAFVDGGTVAWPGSIDIAPETLIWKGPQPPDESARPKARMRLRAAA